MNKLSTAHRSEIAVLKIELAANEKGYYVSYPRHQILRYDMLIDTGEKIYRTQIKYCNKIKKNILDLTIEDTRFKYRKCYTKTQIDLLLLYVPKFDSILCLYPSDFHNKKRIYFNLSNPKAANFYQKFLW